ncbi:hypothetical protein HET68_27675, partial [Streptomyces sp. McG8]|nr:hypothetical protein [Streptomyces sp. McG8]
MEQGRERETPGTRPGGARVTVHRLAGRLRRGLLAALVAAAVAVPLAGAARPQAPA